MPLVVVCGQPSSGKSRRTRELAQALKDRGHVVRVVSEAAALEASRLKKDDCFNNSHQERQLRSGLKARVIAQLDPNHTIIFDASNYIKGYRYELYCASKSAKTTQCTIYTIINTEEARKYNELRSGNADANSQLLSNNNAIIQDDFDYVDSQPYSKETFDALVLRFEEPNSQNRWDSPLFIVQSDEALNVDSICGALYERKPPPPNQSTQNPPLSSTNFLYELDKITQEISKQILDRKKINAHTDMSFADYPGSVLDADSMQNVQPPLLLRLRRQFLTFAKMQYSNHDPKQIGPLYLQYLDTNLKKL